jgi:hypothetical protein
VAKKWSIRRTSVDVIDDEQQPRSPAQEARRADQEEQDYSGKFGKPRHASGRVLRRVELHVRRHRNEVKRAEKLAAAKTADGSLGSGERVGVDTASTPTAGLSYGLGRVRQVIVKSHYHQHRGSERGIGQGSRGGQPLRQHLDYLARPEAQEERDDVADEQLPAAVNQAPAERLEVFFDAAQDVIADAEVADLPARWQQDRHHWRIIVAPDLSLDERATLDLKSMARGYVKRLEKVLDTQLEWTGAVHVNTDHPHVHLLIRGRRSNGRDLVIKPEQIAHTLPAEARGEVVDQIGLRDERDADRALRAMAAKSRLTSLDELLQQLSKEAGEKPFAVPSEWLPDQAGRHHLIARLKTLEALGIAERVTQPGRWWGSRERWKLRPVWQGMLQRMGEQIAVEKSQRVPKASVETTAVKPPTKQAPARESGVEL